MYYLWAACKEKALLINDNYNLTLIIGINYKRASTADVLYLRSYLKN